MTMCALLYAYCICGDVGVADGHIASFVVLLHQCDQYAYMSRAHVIQILQYVLSPDAAGMGLICVLFAM